ncbi:MAG: peroxiredoxin [Cyclobacteriaceae bacterium]|nr:peroxiredoxin [Cyclobacteriaceae bacterium]
MKNSLKIGEVLPSFALPNQDNITTSIDSLRAGNNLVLYFYPKDDTFVCTKEACNFRNNYDQFLSYNCSVVGISADLPKSHQAFIKRHNLPFTLLSDIDNKVRNLLGVPRDFLGLLPGRYTYVIDKDGVVKAIINDHLNASTHITQSLKALEDEQRTNH